MFYKNVIRDSFQTKDIYKLLKSLKDKYNDGYYVYGRKFDHSCSTSRDVKSLTNYIARYASHPPISERRITNFDIDKKLVTWFYDPHEDDDVQDEDKKIGRQFITENVFSFMERLIIHIPDKGFQLIRYYGFYANKFKNKITNFSLFSNAELSKMKDNTYWINNLKSSFGYDPTLCQCGFQMILNFELSYFPSRGRLDET